MKTKILFSVFTVLLIACAPKSSVITQKATATVAKQTLEKLINIAYPNAHYNEPLDGRLILMISPHNNTDLRFQLSDNVNSCQAFGMDVENWMPGKNQTFDLNAFGYPIQEFDNIPAGEYYVQVLFHKYETFNRADGHIVKLPIDEYQW